MGVASGRSVPGEGRHGDLEMRYVPARADVQVGDVVVTSGLDRMFPKGLAVGRVRAVGAGTGLFKDVRVEPSARFATLEEVLVVLRPRRTPSRGPVNEGLLTGLAILLALLVQSSLSRLLPTEAPLLDPFLLVVVYCALVGGETHGMLAGAAAGWVQDVHFGGTVLGFAPLSKIVVGFGVGLAASRFMLTGPGPRTLTLLVAALADALDLRLARLRLRREDGRPLASRPRLAGHRERGGRAWCSSSSSIAACAGSAWLEDLRGPAGRPEPPRGGAVGGGGAPRPRGPLLLEPAGGAGPLLQGPRGEQPHPGRDHRGARGGRCSTARADARGEPAFLQRGLHPRAQPRPRRDSEPGGERAPGGGGPDPRATGPPARSLPPRRAEDRRRSRRRRGRGGAPMGAPRGECGGRAPALVSPGRGGRPLSRPRGRSERAAAPAARVRGAAGGRARGPGGARVPVQPQPHGQGRPAAGDRQQPGPRGGRGGTRGAPRRAAPHPDPGRGAAEGDGGRLPGPVGERRGPRPRDRRDPGHDLDPGLRPEPLHHGHRGRALAEALHRSRDPAHEPGDPGRLRSRSTFKVAEAIAGLEEGLITPSTTVYCPGYYAIYGTIFRCNVPGGHGIVSLQRAIAKSCNVYFYQLGVRLEIGRLSTWGKKLGLGSVTGVDLPHEALGLMPSPEWKLRVQKVPWYPGETVSVAIGQGQVSVTPLQLARLAALVANGGRLVRPHLVKSIGGVPVPWEPPTDVGLKPENVRAVLEGMREVVAAGTGWRARIAGIEVGGKTGSAQVVARARLARDPKSHKLLPHGWFLCFAPVDTPKIAMAVLVEHGGSGGEAAAPVAREILARYFGKAASAAKSSSPAGITDEERPVEGQP